MATTRREFVHRAGLAASAGLLGGCASVKTFDCAAVPSPDAPLCTARHGFRNWSGTIEFEPNRFCQPRTEEELVSLVKEARNAGTHVRTQGAGHSFSQLLPTQDTLVSLDYLDGEIKVDGTRAKIPGGMRLKCAIDELRKRGLGFRNIGSVTEQSIAGAFSTGTHGSGLGLGSMSTQVVGARLVTGEGEILEITEADAQDLSAARLNLGALGIITEVTLECVPDYRLEHATYLTHLEDVIGEIDTLIAENDRVVLWWLLLPPAPRNTVVLHTKNAVGGARGRLASRADVQVSADLRDGRLSLAEKDLREAARAAPASGFTKIFEGISNYDEALTIPLLPVAHRECEYAIPVDRTVEALNAMREVVEEGDITLTLPVELRWVARDDILLSPSNGRDVCWIGASTLANSTEVFERFEPIMRSLGGKPHWGKNFTLTQAEIAQDLYPATYDRFRDVRNRLDPDRVFTNTMLTELLP